MISADELAKRIARQVADCECEECLRPLIEADRAAVALAAKLEVLREIDQRRIMIQREPKPEQVGLTRLGAHEAAIDELLAKYTAAQAGEKR